MLQYFDKQVCIFQKVFLISQRHFKHTQPLFTSACLSISCVYWGRSSKCSIMVAMVIVRVTDTPAVYSRFCKICSVRAGLTFTMAGLTHTLTSCEGSDWLNISMTPSAVPCRKRFYQFFFFFLCFLVYYLCCGTSV